MLTSVKKDGHWWDVEVTRKYAHPHLRPAWLVRYEGGKKHRNLLCQLVKMGRNSWTVVVDGEVVGVRLVEGFGTRWQAIRYALEIRPDINAEYKANR